MKKIKYLVISLLMFITALRVVNAATISVSPSSSSVTVGDNITVTATVGGEDASVWNYCLSYSGPVSPSGSTCVTAGSVTSGRSATFTFKTTASGTVTFGVKDIWVVKDDGNDAPVSPGSASVTVSQKSTGVNTNNNGTPKKIETSRPNVNASTDATLSRLYIDEFEIEPAFSKDVKEYKLDVANDVTSINIHFATTEDAATVSGAGIRELTEGTNKIDLIVTAPKGNQETYTIMVTRAELDPVIAKVDGKDYKVVRKVEELGELLNGFTPGTITIDEKEIPVFINEATKITLVGLKDENGEVKLYIYEDGQYSEYRVVSGMLVSLIPYLSETKVEGYDKSRFIEIDKTKVEVFYKEESDKLVLIYGLNVNTGEKGWYYYDTEEGTLQKYREEVKKEETSNRDSTFLIASFIFAGIALLCLVLSLVILSINKRLRDKNNVLFKMVESSRKGHWENAVELSDKDGLSSGKTGEFDPFTEEFSSLDIDGDGKKDFNKEDFKKDEEIEDKTKEVKKLSPAEEKIVDNIAKANEKTFVVENEETVANTIVDDITLENEVVRKGSNVLSKRDLRKMAKAQKKKEKRDIKKAQKEFLDDVEFDNSAFDTFIREETEIIPVVEDYKKKVKKVNKDKKKKNKKNKVKKDV